MAAHASFRTVYAWEVIPCPLWVKKAGKTLHPRHIRFTPQKRTLGGASRSAFDCRALGREMKLKQYCASNPPKARRPLLLSELAYPAGFIGPGARVTVSGITEIVS
jgi:hypothetical protein